jgi:DNA (cytosine-5)-methyltransferase 1
MRAIELFAGAGGLAIGTSRAGFKHEAILEWNKDACDTIRENQLRGVGVVKDWPLFQGDVRDFDYGTIRRGIELVAGGPPCQPFSLGGKHQAHLDHRDMFPEAVRAVRELRPKAFMIENVKGLTRQAFASYFEYITLQLTYPEITRKAGENWGDHLSRLERHQTGRGSQSLSYRVVYRVLNAADYGVPQKRERVVIVGFREDLNKEWSFPAPTHTEDALFRSQWITGEYWEYHKIAKRKRPEMPAKLDLKHLRLRASKGEPLFDQRWRTVRDAIGDLPDPEDASASKVIPNHRLNPGARVYPGHTGSLLDVPAKTLKAGGHGVPGGENMLVKPDGSVRYFTIRESARLQAFPDEYIFRGSWGEAMRQLGNAVPVTLGEVVANSIRENLQAASSRRKRA